MRKNIFVGGLKQLATAFNTEVNRAKVQVYWENLQDLSDEDFNRAVKYLLRNNQFFPTIAEIRKAVEGDIEAEGIDAWQEVEEQFRVTGYYRAPRFSHPLIYEVVQGLGGWKYICSLPINENQYLRANFLKTYRVLRQREKRDEIFELPARERKEIEGEK